MAAEEENKRKKERCKKFTERVNLNIADAGKLVQNIIKTSRSHEILSQSTKKFVNQEHTIESTENHIRRVASIIEQMDPQHNEIQRRLNLISQIDHQMHPSSDS